MKKKKYSEITAQTNVLFTYQNPLDEKPKCTDWRYKIDFIEPNYIKKPE